MRITVLAFMALAAPLAVPVHAAPPLTTAPFDTTLRSLPAGYGGNDPIAVFKAFALTFTPKGEFETTDAYKARVAAAAATPLVGSLQTTSLMAFRLAPATVTTRYDADRGQMSVAVMMDKLDIFDDNNLFTVQQDEDVPDGSYPAQNAFGAEVTVDKYQRRMLRLCMTNPRDFRFKWSDDLKNEAAFQIPVAPSDAPAVKPALAALVVFRPSAQDVPNVFVAKKERTTTPTRDWPQEIHITQLLVFGKVYELVIFNANTGQIYQAVPSAAMKTINLAPSAAAAPDTTPSASPAAATAPATQPKVRIGAVGNFQTKSGLSVRGHVKSFDGDSYVVNTPAGDKTVKVGDLSYADEVSPPPGQ